MEHVLMILGPSRSSAKMIPIYYELQRSGISVKIAATNPKDEVITQLFDLFDLHSEMEIIYDAELNKLQETALQQFNTLLDKVNPALVLVEGENKTTMTACLASYFRKIPVCHIEAGVKRPVREYPKNQKLLNLLTSYHFTSTPSATAHILAQGTPHNAVFSIGNLTKDLIKILHAKILANALTISLDTQEATSYAQVQCYKKLLVSFNQKNYTASQLNDVFMALEELLSKNADVCIFFASEENTVPYKNLTDHDRFFICPIQSFADEIYALQASDFVLTDSEYLHEEALCLLKHVFFMHATTDAVEGVWAGRTTLTSADGQKILKAWQMLEKKQKIEDNPQKGTSSACKIAEIITRLVRQIPLKLKANECSL